MVRPVPLERREVDRHLIAIAVTRKLLTMVEGAKDLHDAKERIKGYLEDTIEQLENLIEELAP